MTAPFEGADAFNVRGAVVPMETFLTTLAEVAPRRRDLVTHGDFRLPIAPDLDDARLDARLGTSPHVASRRDRGNHRRFADLKAQGRLDLADLPL